MHDNPRLVFPTQGSSIIQRKLRLGVTAAEPVSPGYPGSGDTTRTPWQPSISWNLSKKLSLSIALLSAAVQYYCFLKDYIFTKERRTQGVCGSCPT